jgi:hypothetical protein
MDYPTNEAEFNERQAEFKRLLEDEAAFYASVLLRIEHQELYFRAHMDLLYIDVMCMLKYTAMHAQVVVFINTITSQFHNYLNVYRELREYLIDSPLISQINAIDQLLTDETAARIAPHLTYDQLCQLSKSPAMRRVFETRAIELLDMDHKFQNQCVTVPYEMRRLACHAWRLGRLYKPVSRQTQASPPTILSIWANLRALRHCVDSHALTRYDQAIDALAALHATQQTEEIARLKKLMQ